MCGILVSVNTAGPGAVSTGYAPEDCGWTDFIAANSARGPDSQCTHTLDLDVDGGELRLNFFSSVLHLCGDHITKQPLINERGDVFCWNGEVFQGLNIQEGENDGELLFRELCDKPTVDPCSVFAHIEGPYAFVYFQRSTRRLYFGRDPVGRRSLLLYFKPNIKSGFLLTSVGIGTKDVPLVEVAPESIHCLDLDNWHFQKTGQALSSFPRTVPDVVNDFLQPVDVNPEVPTGTMGDSELELLMTPAVDDFLVHLEQSVRLRVRNIPRIASSRPDDSRIAVLFSGGVDCTILAMLAHKCLPITESIDLLNVAFENPRKLALTNDQGRDNRSLTTEMKPRKPHGTVGEAQPSQPMYDVPDRITGREAVEELRSISPGRRWNFVAIDVPYEECLKAQPTVERLMLPNNTVMDLSLANALYFASRGIGLCGQMDGALEHYVSPARVLLSGLGADEQLGGYARHRQSYARSQWQGLVEELQMDITRLPSRNLGRDDRVISSWGKETRYPYLSLSFIAFISRLPVYLKVNPSLPEGMGDKWLLRLAAKKLGLEKASLRRKRAMQFGSRSARMKVDNTDRNGDVVIG